MRHGFIPGDKLLLASTGALRYMVRRTEPEIQSVKVLDHERKDERYLDDADLRLQIATGEIRLARQSVESGFGLSRRAPADDAANAAHQAAMRLVRELKQLRRGYGVSFNKAYDQLAAQAREERGEDAVPQRSRSHAYRLLKRERNGQPLHRGNATKGNRTERYDEKVFDVVVDMANKHFLEPDSVWRIGAFTEAVNMRLHDAGHIPLDKNVSKKFVLRVILTRVHVDPEHCRMQPKDAIGAKAVARKKIEVAPV